jgi:hypothetical protein
MKTRIITPSSLLEHQARPLERIPIIEPLGTFRWWQAVPAYVLILALSFDDSCSHDRVAGSFRTRTSFRTLRNLARLLKKLGLVVMVTTCLSVLWVAHLVFLPLPCMMSFDVLESPGIYLLIGRISVTFAYKLYALLSMRAEFGPPTVPYLVPWVGTALSIRVSAVWCGSGPKAGLAVVRSTVLENPGTESPSGLGSQHSKTGQDWTRPHSLFVKLKGVSKGRMSEED